MGFNSGFKGLIVNKSGFSWEILWKFPIPNFMKIHLVEAEVIHADRVTDGQTDNMKVIGAFHKYVNVHKSSKWLQHGYYDPQLVSGIFFVCLIFNEIWDKLIPPSVQCHKLCSCRFVSAINDQGQFGIKCRKEPFSKMHGFQTGVLLLCLRWSHQQLVQ